MDNLEKFVKEQNNDAWNKLLNQNDWDGKFECGGITKNTILMAKYVPLLLNNEHKRKIDDDRRKETKTDCTI